jgi:hypothetical protein
MRVLSSVLLNYLAVQAIISAKLQRKPNEKEVLDLNCASNALPAADESCAVASQLGHHRDDEGECVGGSSAGDRAL